MGMRTAPLTVAVAMSVAVLGAAALPDGLVAVTPVAHLTGAAGPECFEATGTHHAQTLLGNTFYRFTHRAEWCTDGTNVVSVDNRAHKMTDTSAFATFEGLVEDYTSKVPAREVTSIMKGRVDNCVPVQGCLHSEYPFVELTLRADGTWSASTGQSESSS